MADYRLPMDADGMKYHGTVDQNEENPGQFMYGLDENGNKRIIRTDEQGNVLTKVTGSKVERVIILESTAMTEDRLNTQVIDVSKYNKVTYYINSTINVDLEVRARINGSYVRYFDASSNTWKDTFEGGILPAYSYNRWRPLNNLHPPLNDLHYDVRFDLRTNEIPTEGSVEIILVGELN